MLAAAGVAVRRSLRRLRCVAARRRLAADDSDRPARHERLRFVATPLEHPLEAPEPRDGRGLKPSTRSPRRSCRRPPATRQLARLRTPGALAVTTGQQPGLFTGPLYTIHKALSAAALAAMLEARWGRPVVPVFWLAGDDHDFAEASTGVLDRGRRHRRHGVRCRLGPPTRRSRRCTASRWARACGPRSTQLAAGLPPSEFRDATLAWLERHYRPEATVAGELRAAPWRSCSARWASSCFDSTHPAAKRAAAPHPRARAADRPASSTTISTAGPRPRARPPGPRAITVGDGAALVMVEASLGRDRLVRDGDRTS